MPQNYRDNIYIKNKDLNTITSDAQTKDKAQNDWNKHK